MASIRNSSGTRSGCRTSTVRSRFRRASRSPCGTGRRALSDEGAILPFLTVVPYTHCMRFPTFKHPVTGTAIPVGALRAAQSCGIGEFPDLVPFAEFCAESGIDLIQLLPVNDTGTESSPYSALSAFALHPIYLRIGALPEAA